MDESPIAQRARDIALQYLSEKIRLEAVDAGDIGSFYAYEPADACRFFRVTWPETPPMNGANTYIGVSTVSGRVWTFQAGE